MFKVFAFGFDIRIKTILPLNQCRSIVLASNLMKCCFSLSTSLLGF